MLVLKLCGNQRVDGVGRLRFDVRTGLKADEAEWKKRDVHTRHETATLELGKAVAWHYSPVGKPSELWFRFGVIVDIIGGKLKEDKAGKNSNPDVNVTIRAFDPPLRYPLNESDLKDKFRVIGDEDDAAEALEDLKRKKKAEHKREMKKKEEKGPAAVLKSNLATRFSPNRDH